MTLKRIFFFFLFLSTSIGYSQLSDFNLSVNSTNETCAGNATLQMSVSNTTTGADIEYKLYLSPDFTNAIAETTSSSFGSLQSGNYRIIAIQSLNGSSNTQQQDVTIQDLMVDLDYEISHTTVTACDVTGTITVNVLSGNAVSYEIISGPILRPLQASNVFTGLPAGTYIIRVFDDCNDALSKTYTMFLFTNNLDISPAKLPIVYDSCTEVLVTNVINPAAGTQIIYPLTIIYTLHPPDGSPDQVTTQTITSGSPNSLELTNILPLYGDQIFDFDLEITDNCGNLFSLVNTINPNPLIGLALQGAACSTYYLSLSVIGFFPPYTINFEEAPDGFDPHQFNELYPGPVTESIVEFGDDETPVPFGTYKATIVDACGRAGTIEIIVSETKLEPITSAASSKCGVGLGFVRIEIPDDRIIVSALITEGPPEYTTPLPSNIISFVDADGILIAELPAGDYVITIIDDCGYEYIIEETVPEFVIQPLLASPLPNCDPGTGSLKITSRNGKVVSIIMTAAPLTYLETLPYDVTFNIEVTSGIFYMSNLPAGNYTFKVIDECGFELETSVYITGYISTSDAYTLVRNCGSFNLSVNDNDITVTNKTYWFQRFFPGTNTWGHPYTGASYPEGTLPNNTNSIKLINFDTVYNLFLVGEFRILKAFDSYNSGSGNISCIDTFATFTISDKLILKAAYSLDCNGGSGPLDVILHAVGVGPFTYSITTPFVFNNGNNNIFTGLAAGIYDFKVADNCGNIENITVEVGNLLPLARATKPTSMLICRNDNNQVGVFMLSDQNAQILGNQNPNDYNVTYHLSQADADTGNAPLEEAYTNISNPQTIYARVVHKVLGICFATTSFQLFIGNRPILTPTNPLFICEGNTKTLSADSGFDTYEWSTGETTSSIVITKPGTYSVIVKNVYEDFTCDASKEFIVTGSGIASFESVSTVDWSASSNTITVTVTGAGDYMYSLDNETFQPTSTFTDLLPGNYTVYVKDINGCGTIKDDFSLLNYPNFFTPNGDGYNDTWNIKFGSFEPNLKVDIFDRYGKFIIQLFGSGTGWDGTYNGKPLPSTDYWFVVKREDGTTHKGHFALKR